MTRARAALPLALAACTLPPPELEGAHLRLAADPGLELCAGSFDHMDATVAALADELGVPRPAGDGRVVFHWLRPVDFAERTVCINKGGGCTYDEGIYTTAAPHDHELVHAVAWPYGVAHPFFMEGLAVAYELPTSDDGQTLGESPTVAEAMTTRRQFWLPAELYPLAGAFTAFLIERHGLAGYLRVYSRLRYADTNARVSRVLEDELGEPLAALIDLFESTRRDCPADGFRLKRHECGAPGLEWDGVTLAAYQVLDCADDVEALGPFRGDLTAVHRTLEVPEDATYELTAVGDAAPGTWVTPLNQVELLRCGGCDGFREETATAGAATREVHLPAGRYAVILRGPSAEPTGVGLRLARVAVGPPPPEEPVPLPPAM